MAQAILLDLDGTLLDTLADLAESCNSVLRARGRPEHAVDAYRYFVGDGMEVLARRVLPEGDRTDAHVLDFVKELRVVYGGRQTLKTRPYEGIDEMLGGLAGRGLALTVLSNKPVDAVRALVAHYFPRHRFAAVRGAAPGVPRKPDPAPAVAIARELAIPAERFLYLGDTATDMQTAAAAGMYALGALWGFREAEELRRSGARALVATPRDVLGYCDAAGG